MVTMALDALDAVKKRPKSIEDPPSLTRRASKKKVKLQRTGLSQKELRLVLLETLYAFGGDATTREMVPSLGW
jgi:hypothetical protein